MIQWGGAAPSASLERMLEGILARIYDATPDEGQLKLFQNDITPSIASVPADFVQATFSGYAAIDLPDTEIPGTLIDVNGNAYAIDLLIRQFVQSADTVVNTVYGYYITNNAGTSLYMAKRFDTPVDFSHAGKTIQIELAYRVIVGGLQPGDDTTVSA